jgi:hypothetical protein
VRLWIALGSALAAIAATVRYALTRPKPVAHALIVTADQHTTFDDDRGVRSVQEADLILPTEALDEIWTPRDLERLARTYWRSLSRFTLGLVKVDYRDDGRQVKALGLIPLLTFQEPEYEMDAHQGIVRWRIEKGVLVAKQGRGGNGYLEILMARRPSQDYDGSSIAHVEVEVANFYPAIASSLGRWLYENTQSRIHVIVTHAFLRSLANLELEPSRVGTLRAVAEAAITPAARR